MPHSSTQEAEAWAWNSVQLIPPTPPLPLNPYGLACPQLQPYAVGRWCSPTSIFYSYLMNARPLESCIDAQLQGSLEGAGTSWPVKFGNGHWKDDGLYFHS